MENIHGIMECHANDNVSFTDKDGIEYTINKHLFRQLTEDQKYRALHNIRKIKNQHLESFTQVSSPLIHEAKAEFVHPTRKNNTCWTSAVDLQHRDVVVDVDKKELPREYASNDSFSNKPHRDWMKFDLGCLPRNFRFSERMLTSIAMDACTDAIHLEEAASSSTNRSQMSQSDAASDTFQLGDFFFWELYSSLKFERFFYMKNLPNES